MPHIEVRQGVTRQELEGCVRMRAIDIRPTPPVDRNLHNVDGKEFPSSDVPNEFGLFRIVLVVAPDLVGFHGIQQ